ncbi:FAD-binding oxidoreductase [Xylocopilactobacillus apis]|uniref:FAD-binding protein n=1 Tax=Xylocopilactobacillus apis TaxID=2932183 RepID=A0AAU9DEL9_9LACO|nr:FAD-linked oxidase C-terminal domain-containing protein [Xylocopilactobacillus apis]BDR56626.1 FAD-binding protein [Xylocopilactobacillus apis]
MTIFGAYTNSEILNYLKEQTPHAEIHIDDKEALDHSANGKAENSIQGKILAYVEVGDVEDIRGVLKTARKFHVPVVPQTADTSTVIGADGINGSIILSVKKLNHIKELNVDDSLAVVEPGVINQELDNAAREKGLFYAPDPASKPISSIGGNVSTNAGGMSCLKYGATKDNILGLKVMLADGREIKLGGRTLKQAFGYDLTQLFIGSEGTLGIVTEITVRLRPLPLGKSVTGMAFFNDMTALAKCVNKLRLSGLNFSMLEALDGKTVVALDEYEKTNYAKSDSSSMLIFGFDDASEQEPKVSEKILKENGAWGIEITTDPEKAKKLIKLRQDMLLAVFAQSDYYIMEDMAVPLSKLAEMVDYIAKVTKDQNVMIYTAGHAGDGNLHPTFLWNGQSEAPDNVIEGIRLLFRKTLSLGGTISGEHAVGMSKNQWTVEELGSNVDQIQHEIKNLFDPLGILNPKRKIN